MTHPDSQTDPGVSKTLRASEKAELTTDIGTARTHSVDTALADTIANDTSSAATLPARGASANSSPAIVNMLVPQRIGRYEVRGQLGEGAMGTVYSAFDPQLERLVALKLMRISDEYEAHEAAQRMLREARAMARVSHPNVVQVYEVGELECELFVAMELVSGKNLKEWLASGRRSWQDVLEVFIQAGAGLAAAHDATILHRDFKPANVFVGDDGRIRVGDFGLARRGSPKVLVSTQKSTELAKFEEVTLTPGGALVGTPAYMSPEQFRMETTDERSDLFAFCVALWEGVFGERPFLGKTVAHLACSVTRGERRVPPRGRRVPRWLWTTLIKGLEVDPRKRHSSMHELLVELGGIDDHAAAMVARGAHRRRQNELILLARVRHLWIEGVLDKNLHGQIVLQLKKSEVPGAVSQDLQITVDKVDEDKDPLPEDLAIVDYFDRRGRALLILGEPGAGKTTTLLELTRDLLKRAEADRNEPLPIVVNLGSWTGQPFETWVVEQLVDLYRIPRKLARAWLDGEALTLMLDGLDEVRRGRRESCLREINRFRRAHGLTPLAVTCRTEEYSELAGALCLDGALELRNLDDGAIEQFLLAGGSMLSGLREQIALDARLARLARSPLMLGILSLGYRDHDLESQMYRSQVDAFRDILDRFVLNMLNRHRGQSDGQTSNAADRAYKKNTVIWLSLLARWVVERDFSVFMVERVQPQILRSRLAKFVYCTLLGLTFSFALLSCVALFSGLSWWLPLFGLPPAFVMGLFEAWALTGPKKHRIAASVVVGLVVFLSWAWWLIPVTAAGGLFGSGAFTGLLVSWTMILSLPPAVAGLYFARRWIRHSTCSSIRAREQTFVRWRRLLVLTLLMSVLPSWMLWLTHERRRASTLYVADVNEPVSRRYLPSVPSDAHFGWLSDEDIFWLSASGELFLVDSRDLTRTKLADSSGVPDVSPSLRLMATDDESHPDTGKAEYKVWCIDSWQGCGEIKLDLEESLSAVGVQFDAAEERALVEAVESHRSGDDGLWSPHTITLRSVWVVVDLESGNTLFTSPRECSSATTPSDCYRQFPDVCRPALYRRGARRSERIHLGARQ